MPTRPSAIPTTNIVQLRPAISGPTWLKSSRKAPNRPTTTVAIIDIRLAAADDLDTSPVCAGRLFRIHDSERSQTTKNRLRKFKAGRLDCTRLRTRGSYRNCDICDRRLETSSYVLGAKTRHIRGFWH